MGEQFNVLKSPSDPSHRDFMRFEIQEVYAIEPYGAIVRPINTVDQVKDRGLSRTIGAYDGKDLSFVHIEAAVIERPQASEIDR